LLAQPTIDDLHDVVNVGRFKRAPLGNLVPLAETSAATGRGRVLSDDDRMAAKSCLPAVFDGRGGRESFTDETPR